MNELKNILIIIKEGQLSFIKKILKLLVNTNKSLKLAKPKMMRLEEEIIIQLKVNLPYYKSLKKILIEKGIKVLSSEEYKAILEKYKSTENKEQPEEKEFVEESWGTLMANVSGEPETPIKKLVDNGDYKELVKILKDIRINLDYRNEAEAKIPTAVRKAIEIIIENKSKELSDENSDDNNLIEGTSQNDSVEVEESIESSKLMIIKKIVKIASSEMLKNLHQDNLLKEVGNKAIELSAKDEATYSYLITLCNNQRLPNISNIEATIKLAEIILPNPEKQYQLVADAVNNLNIRWLSIAFDSVPRDFSSSDENLFFSFLRFIREKRKNKIETV